MTNGLLTPSLVRDEKLDKTIEELERSGQLAQAVAEFRSIESTYGGATAKLAAQLLIEMWYESI